MFRMLIKIFKILGHKAYCEGNILIRDLKISLSMILSSEHLQLQKNLVEPFVVHNHHSFIVNHRSQKFQVSHLVL